MKAIIRLIFALGLCTPAAMALGQSSSTIGKSEYFSVVLPSGFQMSEKSPVEDFEIFTISKAAQPYLYIYVGNQPNFPAHEPAAGDDVSKLAVAGVQIFSEWKQGELMRREMLAPLGNTKGWPELLHAWTATLDKNQVAVADQILFSLKAQTR